MPDTQEKYTLDEIATGLGALMEADSDRFCVEELEFLSIAERSLADALPSVTVKPSDDDRAMTQLIDERDHYEQAFANAYLLVMGEVMEWSSAFGTKEALDEMRDEVSRRSQVTVKPLVWVERRNETWESTAWDYKVISNRDGTWRVRKGGRVIFARQKSYDSAVDKAQRDHDAAIRSALEGGE